MQRCGDTPSLNASCFQCFLEKNRNKLKASLTQTKGDPTELTKKGLRNTFTYLKCMLLEMSYNLRNVHWFRFSMRGRSSLLKEHL